MDRRAFFRRDAPARPPYEVLPGVFVPEDSRVRWGEPPPRPDASARTARRTGAPLKVAAGLDPFVPSASAPWSGRRVRHLLRRTGFGTTPAAVQAFEAMTPAQAVDTLVDGVLALPAHPTPAWIDDAPPHWSAPAEQRRTAENCSRFGRVPPASRTRRGEGAPYAVWASGVRRAVRCH